MTRRAVERANPHLLLVDDSTSYGTLESLLEREQFAITRSVNGPEALRFIGSLSVDLVILDLQTTEGSTQEILQAIRHRYSPLHMPVLVVSPSPESNAGREALALGANDWVHKPIDLPLVLARIRLHLACKWATDALEDSEERYQLAVLGAADGLWDWKIRDREMYLSARCEAIVGHSPAALPLDPAALWRYVHPEDVETIRRMGEEHLDGRLPKFDAEFRVLHSDGHYRWVRCRGVARRDPRGQATRMAGSLTDITTVRLVDPLTGLANRALLVDRLTRVLATSKQRGDRCALLILDVDQFRMVNDGLGHGLGDQLLVAVGQRLEQLLGAGRTMTDQTAQADYTLARLGGDEFTILVEHVAEVTDVVRIANRVLMALARPFDVGGREMFCTLTIGIALSSNRGERAEHLLRDAGTALHRAKARGAARFEVFDEHMREEALHRLQLQTELRHAVDRGEFCLFYQPIVSLSTGRLLGLEALARWNHPEKGLTGPLAFISVAEESGLIVPIGRWIIQEACRQMAEWRRTFGESAPQSVSVNLSGQQLRDAQVVDEIAALIAHYRLLPRNLCIEITESSAMANHEQVLGTLQGMKRLQLPLSIDDFGTGYSSLAYLHRFPLNTIKVDRSFVSRLPGDATDVSIIRTIVTLGHSLNMSVIAEGVETTTQLQMLQALGCEGGQGYLFAPPLSVDDMTAWIRRDLGQSRLPASHRRSA